MATRESLWSLTAADMEKISLFGTAGEDLTEEEGALL